MEACLAIALPFETSRLRSVDCVDLLCPTRGHWAYHCHEHSVLARHVHIIVPGNSNDEVGDDVIYLRPSSGREGWFESLKRDIVTTIYLAGWTLLAIIRIRARFASARRPTVVNRKDSREIVLLAQLAIGMAVLPLVYVFTPYLDFANYRFQDATAWVGAAVMAGALWLFWRCHAALRENFSDSLQLRRGHELITTGVYTHIRHPMYAGGWLWSLAHVLLLHNWIAGWSSLLTFGILYFARVPREEQMMLERFGNQYRAYMDRTGRVIPRRA